MRNKSAGGLVRTATQFILTLVLFSLGCGGTEQTVRLDLRIDDTPVDRENGIGIHSYAEILRRVQPVVVSVYSERTVDESDLQKLPGVRPFFGEEGLPQERVKSGIGSGVIVSPQGYVITNNHVIEDAERVIVQLADRREVVASIIGRDPATDIAVLQIRTGRDLPAAVLADSDQVEVGDLVFALGNALGIGHAVTSGIISARGRTGIGILGESGYEDFLQTDASMNVGNSGGPLVDTHGRVVGINTAIASPGGGNVGVGFAVPINMARDVMRSLIETGEVPRGFLGVTLRDPDRLLIEEYGAPARDAVSGVSVVNVIEGSPAAQAGLREGDVLVAIDGEPVTSASDLRLRVSRIPPGTTVTVDLLREGERKEVSAVLGRLVPPPPDPKLDEVELLPGLMVTEVTDQVREQFNLSEEIAGIFVTRVEEDSPYAETFPEGAVILQINRQQVADVAAAREALKQGRNLFFVLFEGSLHYLMVEVPKGAK